MTTLYLFLSLVAGMGESPHVVQAPLPFGTLRQQLTQEYIRQHYDPAAKDIRIHPRMIVIHWTGSSSLKSLLATFEPDELPQGRPELVRGGRVNVSSHYAVDRDGTIYQLMPELWMARHTIGLNRVALGIENVGGPETPLTEAQLSSCAWLTRKLVKEYPDIQYLIGHFEYLQFKGTPLWEERDSEYITQKPDPGTEFMSRLRERLKDLPLRNSYHPPALQDPHHGRRSGETNAPRGLQLNDSEKHTNRARGISQVRISSNLPSIKLTVDGLSLMKRSPWSIGSRRDNSLILYRSVAVQTGGRTPGCVRALPTLNR